MGTILRLSSFIFIFFIVIYSISQLEEIAQVIRADSKYRYSEDTSIYIFGSFTILFSSLVVFSQSISRKYFLVTPTLLFWLLFIFMVFPGVVFTKEISSSNGSYYYMISSLLFALGVFFSSRVLRFRKREEFKTFKKRIYENRFLLLNEKLWLRIVLIISIFLILILQFFTTQNYLLGIDLLRILIETGSSEAGILQQQREDIYVSGLGAFDYLLRYLVRIVIPISALALFIDAFYRRKRFQYLFYIFAFLFGVFIAFGSGSRMFAMHLLLIGLIVFLMYKNLSLKTLGVIFTPALSLLVAQTVVLGRFFTEGFTPIQIIFMSLNRLSERIFLTKGVVTSYVFDYFPNIEEFLAGKSISQSLLGNISNDLSLSRTMFMYIRGGDGTAGPQAFGELYANFGYLGLVFCFLIGFIVQTVSVLSVRTKRITPLKILYISYIAFLIGLVGYGKILAFKTYGIHVLFVFMAINFFILAIIRYAIQKNIILTRKSN
jgi:oligosaccharide repeat unit polymerase